ncbi:unnamed protein product [Plutella xylostella]|uniref:(diamondback moth) hypothetical protein n=1 Tax=Plutella xylostella TaxID=51655 RepID=A0A8S4GDW4_PLUXY|nr:unnamed protein product [Plutella xylostella]
MTISMQRTRRPGHTLDPHQQLGTAPLHFGRSASRAILFLVDAALCHHAPLQAHPDSPWTSPLQHHPDSLGTPHRTHSPDSLRTTRHWLAIKTLGCTEDYRPPVSVGGVMWRTPSH